MHIATNKWVFEEEQHSDVALTLHSPLTCIEYNAGLLCRVVILYYVETGLCMHIGYFHMFMFNSDIL